MFGGFPSVSCLPTSILTKGTDLLCFFALEKDSGGSRSCLQASSLPSFGFTKSGISVIKFTSCTEWKLHVSTPSRNRALFSCRKSGTAWKCVGSYSAGQDPSVGAVMTGHFHERIQALCSVHFVTKSCCREEGRVIFSSLQFLCILLLEDTLYRCKNHSKGAQDSGPSQYVMWLHQPGCINTSPKDYRRTQNGSL